MARLDPYVTTEQFRQRVGRDVGDDDAAIEAVCEAASRSIDGWLGWFPGVFNPGEPGEIRFYTAPYRPMYPAYWCAAPILEIDPFTVITEIATDRGDQTYPDVLDADQYLIGPPNAAVDGWPYTEIAQTGTVLFPWRERGVRITGTFGWPAVPGPIAQAAFLLANRLKSSWTAPFGIAGSGELGQIQAQVDLTPPIKQLIAPYRRLTV